jgi:hypothetical protein
MSKTVAKVVAAIAEVDAAAWDRMANPDDATHNPFVSHAFLAVLEASGCIGGRTGWRPQHLVIEDADGLAAALPCYLKSHSQGEYVFDHGWAEAYHRAGGSYYPKLQVAIPFTPVPGPRLLVRPGPVPAANQQILAAAAVELAKRHAVSSLHMTFVTEAEWTTLGELGFLQRVDQQFHWRNEGYDTFDAFLASLASRKRKAIRKEREQALAPGITVEWVTGRDLTEAHWDAFFEFYMETGSRKWGRPYLNRRFFSLLGAALTNRCLLVMAKRNGRYIAGALNLIGGDGLYGRHWGAIEHHPCLHFEICYYQAIDFAIANRLSRVEAGAQGDHKLARGYMPVPTYSAHWIRDPGFRRAVARYLDEERAYVAEQHDALAACGPYRKVPAEQD